MYLYKKKCESTGAKRSTVQYARYLLSVKYGRYLRDDETADHIDGDKTNDSLENLQVLTLLENINKSNLNVKATLVEIKCPVCESVFIRRKGHTQLVKCNIGKISVCSIKCSNIFKKKVLTEGDRMTISNTQILSIFQRRQADSS